LPTEAKFTVKKEGDILVKLWQTKFFSFLEKKIFRNVQRVKKSEVE